MVAHIAPWRIRRVTIEARRLFRSAGGMGPESTHPGSGEPARALSRGWPWHRACYFCGAVQQLAVYSTLAMTVGLVAVRPSWGARTLSPAVVGAAAVVLCALFGAIGAGDVADAAIAVWRAL